MNLTIYTFYSQFSNIKKNLKKLNKHRQFKSRPNFLQSFGASKFPPNQVQNINAEDETLK